MNQAKAKFEAKDYRGAVALLKGVIDGNPEHADALVLRGQCSYAIASGKTGRQKEKFLKLAQEDFKAADAADAYHETAGDLLDQVETALSSLSMGGASGGAGSVHSDPSSGGTPVSTGIARSRGYGAEPSETYRTAVGAKDARDFRKAARLFGQVIENEERPVMAEAFCLRGECGMEILKSSTANTTKLRILQAAANDFESCVANDPYHERADGLQTKAQKAIGELERMIERGDADDAVSKPGTVASGF
jgi:hypothetical protein